MEYHYQTYAETKRAGFWRIKMGSGKKANMKEHSTD
jgi:hypothetical protein